MPHLLSARNLPKSPAYNPGSGSKNFWHPLMVLSVLLSMLIVTAACGRTAAPAPTETRTIMASPKSLPEDPTFGLPIARIEIVEYGNFTCLDCRSFFMGGIKEQLLMEYGDEVNLIWRDLPADTDLSTQAAQAAQCAYEQNRFWEYHNLLFYQDLPTTNARGAQPEGPSAASAQESADRRQLLLDLADDASLDLDAFIQCLDSGSLHPAIQQDLQQADGSGYQRAPIFTINGQPLAGPPVFSNFKQVIDSLLLPTEQAAGAQ